MAIVEVCFVCLGNICRSPTAESVMRRLVSEAGLDDRIVVDSAGTGAWHVGEPPDERTRRVAQRRGMRMQRVARQFRSIDFERFHYVIAMDKSNLAALRRLPRHNEARVLALLRSFDPQNPVDDDIPDPYYGGEAGFELVLEMCESACRGLLTTITNGLAGAR